MRVVAVALGIVLMVLGTGFLWLGINLAFNPSSDSDPNVVLVVGGLLALLGLVLMACGVGMIVATLEYVLPRWVALVPGALGLAPYPMLMGMPAVLMNLVLLCVAALLLWARRFGWQARLHGPSDGAPVE